MTSSLIGLVVQQHQQALDKDQARPGLLDGLSALARQVLRDVSEGRGTHFNCSGRSAFGGRTGVLLALRKRGLLDTAGELTGAGRAAVVELQGREAQAARESLERIRAIARELQATGKEGKQA